MSKSQRVPPIHTEDTGIVRGRRDLRGYYRSSTGKTIHVTSGHDDGTLTKCTCTGWEVHGKCWHAAALVDDWWRARWGGESLDTLRWREGEIWHYLGLGPDEAETNALRLELTTIGDLVLARLEDQEAA